MFKQTVKLAIRVAAISSAGLGFLVEAPSADAFVFNGASVQDITAADIGKSFKVNFNGNVGGKNVSNLTSWAKFTLQSFTGKEAVFGIQLDNTSTGNITSRTSALGFNLDGADIKSARTGGVFANAHTYDSLPNGFGDIDVCFINNKNNCKGGLGEGNQGGVSTADEVATFTATLQLTQSVQSFAMSNFGVRYQSINGDGFSGASGTGRGTPYYEPPKPKAIPEPSTVTALLVTGFAFIQQRRRKQITKSQG
jgi:hypothetical protein